MIVPFSGTYEYLGDGWYRVVGDPVVSLFLEVPKWSKLKLHVKVRALDPRHYYVSFEAVLRNDKVYLSKGYCFSQGEFVAELDWEKLASGKGVGYCAMVTPNGLCDRKCLINIPGRYCEYAGTPPSTKTMRGVGVGWLDIIVFNADVLFKVEVVP